MLLWWRNQVQGYLQVLGILVASPYSSELVVISHPPAQDVSCGVVNMLIVALFCDDFSTVLVGLFVPFSCCCCRWRFFDSDLDLNLIGTSYMHIMIKNPTNNLFDIENKIADLSINGFQSTCDIRLYKGFSTSDYFCPAYWLGHPEQFSFLLYNKTCIRSLAAIPSSNGALQTNFGCLNNITWLDLIFHCMANWSANKAYRLFWGGASPCVPQPSHDKIHLRNHKNTKKT